ncbi:hypothetical protein BDN70DRAFT_871821 [Pholiota conissans]|uniref:MYND-type domain-containing protein n=1 Tax=Pholiota conissans TaxID=109636 RepID=A0A9P6D6P6_9AGAR|nr:hypothetical protein BDN70DRAFT_871821 [Pholiota conissans]
MSNSDSWRDWQLANLKKQLEIASTVRMTHPDAYDAPCPSGMPMDPQSTQDIKKKRKQLAKSCVGCKQLETKDRVFKVCSKCQARFYCSKECQRNDWPEHKLTCSKFQRQKRLQKLATTLFVNFDLSAFLSFAVIYKLGLLNPPKRDREPFSILVHLAVEPVDILDFARIRGDLGPDEAAITGGRKQGMIQVTGILPCPEHLLPHETLAEFGRLKGSKSVEYASGNSGPVGALVFMLGDVTFELPSVIVAGILEMAREADPFTQIIGDTGRTRTLPITVETCIEYINTKIRADKDNRFLLRTEVTAVDEEFIRKAAKDVDPLAEDSIFLALAKQRMRNEYIYKILLGLTLVPIR